MTDRVQIVSPIDGRVYAERKVATGAEIDAAVAKTRRAREVWAEVTVQASACKFLEHFLDASAGKKNDAIVPELAWQMGRPVRYQRRAEARRRGALAAT
jgi:acyl-CoA reductase-like NAD-dependent aldehyde dehydrogenase